MTDRRMGFVLPLMLLVLVALTTVAHAALTVAANQARVGRITLDHLVVDVAAGAGLRLALADTALFSLDQVPLRATRSSPVQVGRVGVDLVSTRIAKETWIVEASANDQAILARESMLTWVLDPVARVGALAGVVNHGPGAVVDGMGTALPDSLRGGVVCESGLALDSVFDGDWPGAYAELTGSSGEDGLGAVPLSSVTAKLPRVPEAVVTPHPEEDQAGCLRSGLSWGAPTDTSSACHPAVVARGFAGDLTVRGGQGNVFLAVTGDLVLEDAARLRGMLVVGGRLIVTGGSSVHGRVVALAGVTLAAGSTVRGDVCDAVRALEAAAPWIRVPVRIAAATRLGRF